MANHNLTGKKGEALALEFLQGKAFVLLHTNWRYSHYEIDIIAERDEVLHFVEVKTRRTLRYGYPEESVTDKKMEHLMRAAEAFLQSNPHWERVQYDILSIYLNGNEAPEYFFIEDAYL